MTGNGPISKARRWVRAQVRQAHQWMHQHTQAARAWVHKKCAVARQWVQTAWAWVWVRPVRFLLLLGAGWLLYKVYWPILSRTMIFLSTVPLDAKGVDLRGVAFLIGGVLVGLPTLALVAWRSWNIDKQTKTREQGLITDRINAAVANVGADKTTWVGDKQTSEPNIEVRIGGIYALERISQDSARDHIRMMEILTAYVRQNAPAENAVKDIPEQKEGEHVVFYRSRLSQLIPKPRADIQIAIDVLARRQPERIAIEGKWIKVDEQTDEKTIEIRTTGDGHIDDVVVKSKNTWQGYTLDLSNTNLQRIFVEKGGNLNNARFHNAQLAGANFGDAQLRGAIFWDAQLQGADFRGARLQRTKFMDAQLKGADFRRAKLQGVNFTGALFKDTDLRKTKELKPDQLQESFGDGTVTLPDGLTHPDHWPQETLEISDYLDKYKQWLYATYPKLYKQRYGQ